MNTGLVVNGLSCGRGEKALFSDFDLAAPPHSIVRVLGDNGVGKTTLLRTLAGLLPPLTGTVAWQGETTRSAVIESLCFLDFDNALSGVLSPVENLIALVQVAGGRVAAEERRIREVLTQLGLQRLAHRPCSRLSSGQRRRVALARLWLTGAPLWLLDEPAAALDAGARAMLSARISEHAAAGGTVIYTTHEALDLPRARAVSLT